MYGMVNPNRRILFALMLFLLRAPIAHSQDVALEGTIICNERGLASQKRPARYVIVIPQIRPDRAEITTDYGYFRLLVPYREIADQSISLLYVGKSDTIETQKIFIAREDIWDRQFKCATMFLAQPCERFEHDLLAADKKLTSIKQDIADRKTLDYLSAGTGAAGNLLYAMTLLNFAALASPDSTVTDTLDFSAATVSPGRYVSGLLVQRAFSEFSQNIGFNFTPLRNFNEALFWNASALPNATHNQVSFHADYHRYLRITALVKPTADWAVGFGAFWTFHQEQRTATLDSITASDKFRNN